MNRKVLNEVALASAIGAVIGVVVAIVLVAEFELAQWATLIVAGFAGALSGGICYCPGEVGHALAEIGRWLWSNFLSGCKTMVSAKPLIAVEDATVAIGIGVKKQGRTIFKWFYVILLVVMFTVVSRFTIGCSVPLDNNKGAMPEFLQPWASGFGIGLIIVFVAMIVFVAVFYRKGEIRPSWLLPITTRISKRLDGWDVDLPDGKWKVHDFLILGVFVALAPLLACLILPSVLIILAIDIVITLALALSSTERLASMTGALIGTVAGSICYFHEPSYLPAIAVGAVVGGFSGRWLYALRRALVYKDPEASPT